METIFDNLGSIIFFLLMLSSALAPAFKKKQMQQRRAAQKGAPKQRSDLEDRVRRNFEEMMRRRSGQDSPSQQAAAPPTAAPPKRTKSLPEMLLDEFADDTATLERPKAAPAERPATAAPTSRARPSPPSTPAPHSPSTHRLVTDAPAPPRPAFQHELEAVDRSWTSPHQKAKDISWQAAHAYDVEPGLHRSATRGKVSKLMRNRQSIRAAIIAKEILDRPVGLRDQDGPYSCP